MTPIGWMVWPGVAGCVIAAALFGRENGVAILLGMIAPLAAVVVSWRSVERAHRRDPGSVTAVLMAGFAGKMVFFGGYLVVVLKFLGVRPVPFIASFTAYFIGLYLVEAIYLKRLFNS
ncbi:MAG: hypothetical protein ABI868_11470 [Acidobacteriota bacterium]